MLTKVMEKMKEVASKAKTSEKKAIFGGFEEV
jgi:hypothetical protein